METFKYLACAHNCMDIDMVLECGHRFKLSLPNSVFNRGSLIAPCPVCGVKYLVHSDGTMELFKRQPFRFPALHY